MSANLDALASRLAGVVGQAWVRRDKRDLLSYAYDATGERYLPDIVVFPDGTTQVADCVRLAAEAGMPVVPRGAGTNLSGGALPIAGGMVLNLVRMNRVKHIDPEARTAVVEAGIVNEAVQRAAAPFGLFYAPDPSSMKAATIGGSLAENAGGPRCAKYGVTINHALGLTLVLSDGRVIELGGETGDAPGMDLLGLVVGSEGTLGVITESVLHLTPLPQAYRTLLGIFDELPPAVEAVSAIVAARILPATLEIMDRNTLKAVIASEPSTLPEDAGGVLLVEVDGDPRELDAQVDSIVGILTAHGARRIDVAHSAAEREALWNARRAGYGALARHSPSLSAMDVTVPRDRLVDMLREVMRLADEHRLTVCLAAHAGDGNMHPTVPFDPRDPDQRARLAALTDAISRTCVRLGGSISGEHGIGIEKLAGMPLQYPPEVLAEMHLIRKAFDPLGIMNPGKNLPMPAAGW